MPWQHVSFHGVLAKTSTWFPWKLSAADTGPLTPTTGPADTGPLTPTVRERVDSRRVLDTQRALEFDAEDQFLALHGELEHLHVAERPLEIQLTGQRLVEGGRERPR